MHTCEKWALQPTSTQDGGDKDTLRLGGDGVKTQQTANVDCGEKCRFIYSAIKYVIWHTSTKKRLPKIQTKMNPLVSEFK